MKILGTLFNSSQSIPGYIGKAFLISAIPSLALAWMLWLLFPDAESPSITYEGGLMPLLILFVSIVIFGPLLETSIMRFFIFLIRKVTQKLWPITFLSAFIWAVLHSLSVPLWGVVAFWPFVVFTISFQVWREVSINHALLITSAIHGCHNFIAFMIVVSDYYW